MRTSDSSCMCITFNFWLEGIFEGLIQSSSDSGRLLPSLFHLQLLRAGLLNSTENFLYALPYLLIRGYFWGSNSVFSSFDSGWLLSSLIRTTRVCTICSMLRWCTDPIKLFHCCNCCWGSLILALWKKLIECVSVFSICHTLTTLWLFLTAEPWIC